MKKYLGILSLVSVFSSVAFAQPALEQYDTLIKSCENGQVLITGMKMPYYSPEIEIYFVGAQTIQSVSSILRQDVLQGLDKSHYIQMGNETVSYPTAGPMSGAIRFMVVTNPDYNAPAPTAFTSIVSESQMATIFPGRGVADQDIGKVMISPGYYATLDRNRQLTIQFFRTSNYDKGISGLALGELTFSNCQ